MPQTLRHSRAALLSMAGVCLAGVIGVAFAHANARDNTTVARRPAPTRPVAGQDEALKPHAWRIVASKYSFSVPRIEVQQDDLVEITLETADIPHSFTIDEPYRIAKRATPGHPVVFEFRADKAGAFDFYCNLKADDGCRAMKGTLIVKAKR